MKGRIGFLLKDPEREPGFFASFRQPTSIESRLNFGVTTLGDLIDLPFAPIFCTTDLATGSPFYLSSGFVCGSSSVVRTETLERHTRPTTKMIPLVVPLPRVQLSGSGFRVGGVPSSEMPRFYKSEDLGLPLREGLVLRKMCLADGGLRDNFGIRLFTN